MKTPHTNLRSPDLSAPCAKNSCRAPKRGESPFISRGRVSWHDTDLEGRIKVKKERVLTKRESTPVKLKKTKNGFSMTRRINGKFIAPLVFDFSLISRCGGNISLSEIAI